MRWTEPARGGSILRGEEDARQANFLELFFDLVLVFALNGVVTRVVQDLLSGNSGQRWLALLYLVVLALPLLWLWTTTTHITSRFDHRSRRIQLIVLASTFGLLIMAASLPYAFVARGAAFAVPYVLLHAGRPLLLRPLLRDHQALRLLYTRKAIWFGASSVLWFSGAFVRDEQRVAVWSIAITVDLTVGRFGWPVPGMRRFSASAWSMTSSTHLPERYEQLLLIALGETMLAVGLSYISHAATPAASATLVITFLATVLMWRIYFYRAGQVLAEALALSPNRAIAGRTVGTAHVLMVIGTLGVAAGSKIVLEHPGGHTQPAWLAMILGGPAVFLLGRMRLERIVFDRLSWRRVVAIGTLVLLAPPLVLGPPLLAAVAAVVVLLGVAVADALNAAGRPPEAPSPPA
ncbi:low temperature requirement protein A [Micromonospora sp. FIMYZ51]|uniref:low temperature requirement protein A n=1 Tax=Micromonospora sp. FIMYZ51 TaxID=3051832 RepID=UPI00311E4402